MGWPGERVTTDMPMMVNLRQDPFERTPSIRGESLNNGAGGYVNEFFAREFWRFVEVQSYVGRLAETAVQFPPMQAPATFNLDAIKQRVEEMIPEPARAIAAVRGGGFPAPSALHSPRISQMPPRNSAAPTNQWMRPLATSLAEALLVAPAALAR